MSTIAQTDQGRDVVLPKVTTLESELVLLRERMISLREEVVRQTNICSRCCRKVVMR